MSQSIIGLADIVNSLELSERTLFDGLFTVTNSSGRLKLRQAQEKLVGCFKVAGQSTDEVVAGLESQYVVRVHNRATGEGALFNALRARRPGMSLEQLTQDRAKVDAWVEEGKAKGCDFCMPESKTPEDSFGRVYGRHCVTSANVAKYDAWSSVIFFEKHHPLDFTHAELADYVATGFRWFKEAHHVDPWAIHPYLMWNCLSKAAASQQHGHAQVLLAQDRPYEKVGRTHAAAQRYTHEQKRDYFDDLFKVHKSVGLALEHGDAKVLVNLTPVKEKETLIIAPATSLEDHSGRRYLSEALATVARSFIDNLGVHSFNVALACPPLGQENTLPYVARIVDRGSIFNPITDIGGMELYGEPVIASDPYRVMGALRKRFGV